MHGRVFDERHTGHRRRHMFRAPSRVIATVEALGSSSLSLSSSSSFSKVNSLLLVLVSLRLLGWCVQFNRICFFGLNRYIQSNSIQSNSIQFVGFGLFSLEMCALFNCFWLDSSKNRFSILQFTEMSAFSSKFGFFFG